MIESNALRTSLNLVLRYCESCDFAGYDPYDALNSRLFRALPGLRRSRLARLAWIQLFKRSPINFRRLVCVPRQHNPKGLALFLSAYCTLSDIKDWTGDCRDRITDLAARLMALRSPGYDDFCWGYNFPWQARAFYFPAYTPTVVASSYAGGALLDAFHVTQRQEYLDAARSTCRFVLDKLNRSGGPDDTFALSYSPLDHTVVFNASLLGARLLSRTYALTAEPSLIDHAAKIVAFCCTHQQDDGSWYYGTLPHHRWIDSFHTGYNLESIGEYLKQIDDRTAAASLERGLNYYLSTFFNEDGVPKYCSDRTYPIDPHNAAQLFITLYRLGRLSQHRSLVERVFRWTISHLQDRTRGCFYYQIDRRFGRMNIPYMRWTQAWMVLGLASLLRGLGDEQD